jgi:spermidine synthase
LFLALAALDRFASHGAAVRGAACAAGLAVAVGTAWAIPSAATFWGQLHAVPESRIIVQEDGTGLAVLTSPDPFFRRRTDVYVNGLGQSTIPFDGVHSFLGLVPALIHPAPKRIAIIGLGSGDTWYSAAGRPETELIECVEIIGGQIQTLRALHARTGYAGLGVLFSDRRFRFTVGDGRRLIMQSDASYDIIEADALRPSSAYSGNLYSREYFELLRDRLAPGGLAVTWAPTPRIQDTFASVFPHVAEVTPMLIGSNQPIAFDPAAVRARATRPETAQHYEQAGINLDKHLADMLAGFRHVSQGAAPASPAEHRLNTDLFPRDELRVR